MIDLMIDAAVNVGRTLGHLDEIEGTIQDLQMRRDIGQPVSDQELDALVMRHRQIRSEFRRNTRLLEHLIADFKRRFDQEFTVELPEVADKDE